MEKPEYVIGNDIFAGGVANSLGKCKLIEFRREYYIDGEPAPTVNFDYELDGKHVLLVYRRRQRPTRNDVARHITNLLMLIYNLKHQYNVGELDVLYPYYIFGRQDHNPRNDPKPEIKERDRGKSVGYKFIAESFKSIGAERIITFNPHFHRDESVIEIEGLPVICLSAVPKLAEYAEKLMCDGMLKRDSVVLSPDFKGNVLAKEFAKLTGLEYFESEIKKNRINDRKTIHNKIHDMKCRDVVIVDDILSTMGTCEGAINSLKNTGDIDIFAVHPVLPPEGHDKAQSLIGSGKVRRIIATNTIDSDYSRVDISGEVAKVYEKF